jgi:hypothetical protein
MAQSMDRKHWPSTKEKSCEGSKEGQGWGLGEG